MFNKHVVGVRGDRLVILNRLATSVEGLTRADTLNLIGFLVAMSVTLPEGKQITSLEIEDAVTEACGG